MVRTIREPNPSTPQLLRISTSSATSSRRASGGGSPAQPIFTKSKIHSLSSSQNSSSSSGGPVKKRAILGEREDNIILPSQTRSVKSPKSKPKFRSSLTPRSNKSTSGNDNSPNHLSSLSRLVAKSPSNHQVSLNRYDTPSSSSISNSPNSTFMSKPGSTPYLPRSSISMQINEDDTLLWDTRLPEMSLSSPAYDMTDDSDVESSRAGLRGRGGLMTPANSQEVSSGSPRKSSFVTKATALPSSTISNPVSRLPTPPSSQAGSQSMALPPTPQAGPSRISRIRARPSPTPPRRTSNRPSPAIALCDITAEWDTPLRLGDDISPNPRRKKSPRLSQPGQTPTKLRASSEQQQSRSNIEVVIPLRARSNTPAKSLSETPATVKPKAKGRASSKTPSLSSSQTSRRSSDGSRRSSGGSTKTVTILATPAASSGLAKKVPSTAPAGRRKSTPPSTASRKSRNTPPSQESQSKRRASVPANTKTPKGRGGSKSLVAQTPKDIALTGRKLGMLRKPIHGSPGDDPLLLKGRDPVVSRRSEGIRDNTGLALSFDNAPYSSQNQVSESSVSPRQIRDSSPFNLLQNDEEDLTLLPMNSNAASTSYFDVGPAWSDDDSDMEGVGEDTFIHLPHRKENSGVLGRSNVPVLVEEEEEQEEEEGDRTVGLIERTRVERSYTPLLPPRESAQQLSTETVVHEHIEGSGLDNQNHNIIESNVIQEESSFDMAQPVNEQDCEHSSGDIGDVTQEMEQNDWEVSQEDIENIHIICNTDIQPGPEQERTKSPSPSIIEEVGHVAEESKQMNNVVVEEHVQHPVLENNKSPEEMQDARSGEKEDILFPNQLVRREEAEEEEEKEEEEIYEGDKIQIDLKSRQETATSVTHYDNVSAESPNLDTPDTSSVSKHNEQEGFEHTANPEEATEEQRDLSEEGLNLPLFDSASSSPHLPSLGESEEVGDITQDMDVLDWEVSEEDIQPEQSGSVRQSLQEEPVVENGLDGRLGGSAQEEKVDGVEIHAESAPIEVQIEQIATSEPTAEVSVDIEVVHDGEVQNICGADESHGIELEQVPDINAEREVMNDQSEPAVVAFPKDLTPAFDTEIPRSSDAITTPIGSPAIPAISLTVETVQTTGVLQTFHSPIIERSTTPSTTPIPTIYRSTTPSFSPPPPALETRTFRSPSVPKSPLVLIHHRGDLNLTPRPVVTFNNQSQRSPSPPPPPTPVFTFEERGHKILEEADRALRRLSKLRSLSPIPPIAQPQSSSTSSALNSSINTISNTTEGADKEDTAESQIEVRHALVSTSEVRDIKEQELENEESEEQEDVEDESTVGDTTVEADNSAWNLSTEEYDVPLKGDSDEEGDEGTSEEQEKDKMIASSEGYEQEEEREDEAEEEEEEEVEEKQQEQEEHEPETSPKPVEVPERIILSLVEKGIIKLEPESDSEDNVKDKERHSFTEEQEAQASSPFQDQLFTPMHNPTGVRDRSSTCSPAPTSFAGPSTPPIYPSLPLPSIPTQPESSTPKSAPPSSAFRYANPTPQSVTSLERMLSQRSGTSKLSKEILPSSSPSVEPGSSPIQRSSPPFDSPPAQTSNDVDEEGDKSVVIRKPRRLLHDELAAATSTGGGNEKFAGDESFRSVVEVSSLDPKAAARAAAILKLNHAYIEQGVLPKSDKLASSSSSALARSKSSSHTDKEKRDLLHEAELEIVESHRRSRSRSVSRLPDHDTSKETPRREREREMSVMSFMTEDYPVPGAFIKTPNPHGKRTSPMKRKRDLLSLIETSEEHSNDTPSKKNEDKWGVNEWKKLERVYRKEKELWIKERDIKSLPVPVQGGLIAWAKRSTFGSTKNGSEVKVKQWDINDVVGKFLVDEKKEGRIWDEDMLVLRVQAIERRIRKLASSTNSTATVNDPKTPAQKKIRPNTTPSMTISGNSTVLQTPIMNQASDKSTIEPPSTIKRMLGLVWGKSKIKTNTKSNESSHIGHGNLIDKLETSTQPTTKDKGEEREILPITQMREIQPQPQPKSQAQAQLSHPRSTQWTAPAPPPIASSSKSIPVPASSSLREPRSTTSSVPTLTYSTSLPSLDYSTISSQSRLHPPISQRSEALSRLFPNQTGSSNSFTSTSLRSSSIMTASTSEKNLKELEKLKDQKKRNGSGSVKDLVMNWEGKGIMGSSMSGSKQ